MSDLQQEHALTCPYCWSKWHVLLDLSVDAQSYIEDCTVCCNPVSIRYRAEEGTLVEIAAERS